MKKLAVSVAAALVVLTPTAAPAGRADLPGRNGRIAFLRSAGDGPSSLFVIAPDGRGLRQLSPGGLNVASYAWAPDGGRIAYLDAHGALRLVRPDGTGRKLLVAGAPVSQWFMSWSPDGKAIAVDSRDPGTPPSPRNSALHLRINIVSASGGDLRRLPSGDAQDLDWSPLGDEIVYGSGSGLQRVIHTDGNQPRPFFPMPPNHGFGLPTWSPDGAHVGFVGGVRRGRFYDRYSAIYVADANGSNLHLVTSHAYNEYGFVWSPDARWILYGRADRKGIYVIRPDGHDNHRLTTDSPRPAGFRALTWSPDGRSIAYATDRTGNGDIYVIGADGRRKIRLTSSSATDVDPAWQYSRTPCCA